MGSAQRLGPVFRTWAQPDSTRTQAPKEIQVVTDPGSYHLTFSTFCAAKSLAATIDTKMWKVKTVMVHLFAYVLLLKIGTPIACFPIKRKSCRSSNIVR